MCSKDHDQQFEDELQALHQSIEQLNSGSNNNRLSGTDVDEGHGKHASVKRKRPSKAGASRASIDVQTQTPKKCKRKKLTVPEGLIDEQNNAINEILEEIAQRKGLTTHNVKHLLHNIISNESVQEMLKCSLDNTTQRMPFEPKLTRSKTKEWLETQNLPWPPTAKKNNSETCILMTEEFPEDSSDDEYRPTEEDQSDEESLLSSHASDIGSPGSSLAPPTPYAHSQGEDLFKRPLPIDGNTCGEEDLIGLRTRSRLPLNDTLLEHLELAFVPPDISTDMYDSDCDDEEWRKFLKEYVNPPTHHSADNADDEEADPEYNVLEEEEEVDAEELRADRTVQITKKEVSELLSELFEEDFSSSDEEPASVSVAAARPIRSPAPTQDLLQTTICGIVPMEAADTADGCKTPSKPTGVVQPLTPHPSEEVAFTVSFPTLSYSPIDVVSQPFVPLASSYHDLTCAVGTVVLSMESRLLLEEQLRRHVQLLTQIHLITAQQPGLESVTQECSSMLGELLTLRPNVNVANLEEAVDLVNYWDTVVEKLSEEENSKYQWTVVASKKHELRYVKRSNVHPDRFPFNPKMVEVMAQSRVFIYPEMLPKVAIFQVAQGPTMPSVHEEQLIAMGIEQFTPFCSELLKGSKSQKGEKFDQVVANLVSSMISHFMLPHWDAKKIGMRIKRLVKVHADNPVKFYFKNGFAPPLHHVVQSFDSYSVPVLCDVPPSQLPERWREPLIIARGRTSMRKPVAFAQPTPRQAFQSTPATTPQPAPRSSGGSLKRTSRDPGEDGDARQTATPANKPQRRPRKQLHQKTDRGVSSPGLNRPCFSTPVVAAQPPTSYSPLHPECVVPSDSQTVSVAYTIVDPESSPPQQTIEREAEAVDDSGPISVGHAILDSPVVEDPTSRSDRPQEFADEGGSHAVAIPADIGCVATVERTVDDSTSDESGGSVSEQDSEFAEDELDESDSEVCADSRVEMPASTTSKTAKRAIACSDDETEYLDVTGTDSDPEWEASIKPPRIPPKSPRPTSSCSVPYKRYVLIQRLDSNTAEAIHVWGPNLNDEKVIPVRVVADQETNAASGGTHPSQGAQSSTQGQGGQVVVVQSADGGMGGGSSGGDDRDDKPPTSPAGGHSIDDSVMAEDDEEEEDTVALDTLTATPSAAQLAPSKGKSPAHRQIRHRRNAQRILDSWMVDDDQNKNSTYAQIYFTKVRSQLEPRNKAAFHSFVVALSGFDSTSKPVVELYRQVEDILSGYPDLMDEFVLFLSPEAAAQCGVHFKHFLYVRMREFFSKVKIHFKDSPSQLKRFLKTLQQVESSAAPTIADIKNAVLPFLKGNAHLTQAFLQMFLEETPASSDVGDYEEVNMDRTGSGDEFEFVQFRDPVHSFKEQGVKAGKRTGTKGNVRSSKSKDKSWKKS